VAKVGNGERSQQVNHIRGARAVHRHFIGVLAHTADAWQGAQVLLEIEAHAGHLLDASDGAWHVGATTIRSPSHGAVFQTRAQRVKRDRDVERIAHLGKRQSGTAIAGLAHGQFHGARNPDLKTALVIRGPQELGIGIEETHLGDRHVGLGVDDDAHRVYLGMDKTGQEEDREKCVMFHIRAASPSPARRELRRTGWPGWPTAGAWRAARQRHRQP